MAKSKKKDSITSAEDKKIRKELDAADKLVDDGDYDTALKKFDALLDIFPNSPRALYGRAQAEDKVAEKWKSNEWLQTCIDTYGKVPSQKNCPKELKKQALMRQANRLSFYGKLRQAVKAMGRLNELVPGEPEILNQLGVSYLMVGNNNAAKRVFGEVMQIRPEDGFAQVHLGFILKSETRYDEAIPLLREGIQTGEEGTIDGRFFFHLGDALYRTGQPEEYWYKNGADRGLFASMYQRSLYNEPNLRAQPFWTPEDGGDNFIRAVKRLESSWRIIRAEGLKNMDAEKGVFLPEEENLKNTGDWKQFTLFQRGKKQEANCKRAPETCSIISFIKDATGCTRGQVKYSIMQPGTHVWPHTGPTNCRLRMHLGLVIPKNGTRLRVADDIRTWQEGKVLIFDDSFEHEVWQEADSYRMILIIDMWHPDLTDKQKKTLTPI
ncbi:PREDICTED: aspartyl/asparaginyl beta-hydroxylase-like [Branchiostoma belcheri]|uniref:Aspartyl/asparaginyl beta-hydroxylase-like n=1 Tax=Branchiostoma belcheri TaxID=7741 RepID=A0A6P4YW52_BRABE|nr:PREDICTED: aspartyl/asparaginyl beta-hydroxylase-like [Branchiostoma belcheri]